MEKPILNILGDQKRQMKIENKLSFEIDFQTSVEQPHRDYFTSTFAKKRGLFSRMSSLSSSKNDNSPLEDSELISTIHTPKQNVVYPISTLTPKKIGKSSFLSPLKIEPITKTKSEKLAMLKYKLTQFIRKFTPTGRVKTLQNCQNIRKAINDSSDGILLEPKDSFIFKLLEKFKVFMCRVLLKFFSKIDLFDPQSRIIIALESTLTVFNIFFIFFLSLRTAFPRQNFGGFLLIDDLALCLWVIQMFCKLNTLINIDKNQSNQRCVVFETYLRSQFIFDVFPLIFLATLTPDNNLKNLIFKLLVFFKVKNVVSDVQIIKQRICDTTKNYHKLQLFKLIILIFIIGHIVACLWCIVGEVEISLLGYSQTWFDSGIGVDHQWWELYLLAFNWSLTLLTTGQGSADTPLQLFFITFIMIFTTIFFGYVLTVIGSIIEQLEKRDESSRYDLNLINEYINKNKLSQNLSANIRSELVQYYADHEKSKEIEGKKIIQQKLSAQLQNQIQEEFVQRFLQKATLLKRKFSQKTISRLSSIVKEEYYQKNQVIFTQNQPNEICLILVVEGSIQISKSLAGRADTEVVIKNVLQGQLFGEDNLFSGQPYSISARSGDFTKVVKIERNQFIEIVKQSERDYQVFCEIQDRFNISQCYFDFRNQCEFCSEKNHTSEKCCYLNLDRKYIYYKQKFYEKTVQRRVQYNRLQEKTDCLHNLKYTQEAILQFLENNPMLLDSFSETTSNTSDSDEESNKFIQFSSIQKFLDLQNLPNRVRSQRQKPDNNKQQQSRRQMASSFNHYQTQCQQSQDHTNHKNYSTNDTRRNAYSLINVRNMKKNSLEQRQNITTNSSSCNQTKEQNFFTIVSNNNHQGDASSKLFNDKQKVTFKSLQAIQSNSPEIVDNKQKNVSKHSLKKFKKNSQLEIIFSNPQLQVFQNHQYYYAKEHDASILWEFDNLQNWKYYFPHNNSKQVLSKYFRLPHLKTNKQNLKLKRSLSQYSKFNFIS